VLVLLISEVFCGYRPRRLYSLGMNFFHTPSIHNPSVLLIAITVVLLLFDCQNIIARFRKAAPITDESSSDYTLIVPLYGNPSILTNMDFLSKYKENVLLVLNVTTDAMLSFASSVEGEGWKVHRTYYEGRPRVSRLWQDGLSAVKTTYAIRFDADTTSPEDPGCAIRALELSGADYASSKVLVANPRNIIEHLQATEYSISMQARHFRPWMTSGACIMGRTEALQATLAAHSHWGTGEDVEQGIIAKHFKMRVVHLDYKVYTDAPSTAKALFRQRRLWWAGNVRQTLINVDQMAWFPAYLLYSLLLVYASFILRGNILAIQPLQFAETLPVMLVFFVLLTSIVNFQVWSPWFFLFPLYSLVQVGVMPIVGVFTFIQMAYRAHSLGRYKIRWRRERWTASLPETT
jgi:cellulose synthase/poly-beta-1,6-N-acetylglucosamine synthase-like glycosyltransferase